MGPGMATQAQLHALHSTAAPRLCAEQAAASDRVRQNSAYRDSSTGSRPCTQPARTDLARPRHHEICSRGLDFPDVLWRVESTHPTYFASLAHPTEPRPGAALPHRLNKIATNVNFRGASPLNCARRSIKRRGAGLRERQTQRPAAQQQRDQRETKVGVVMAKTHSFWQSAAADGAPEQARSTLYFGLTSSPCVQGPNGWPPHRRRDLAFPQHPLRIVSDVVRAGDARRLSMRTGRTIGITCSKISTCIIVAPALASSSRGSGIVSNLFFIIAHLRASQGHAAIGAGCVSS
jgi:hypothetical protein